MKTSCEIIKDLLPLYHDRACSAESGALVEEHLRECPACERLLAAIAEEITRPVAAADEAKPIKAIQTVWKKDKKRSLLKGALLAAAVCAVLVCGFLGLTQWVVVPVSVDRLEVTDTARLSEDRILYRLIALDDRKLSDYRTTVKPDGSVYMQPLRTVLGGEQPKSGQWPGYAPAELLIDVDIAALNAQKQTDGTGVGITSYHIGTPEKSVLIWRKGMDIPAADEYLVDMFLMQIMREHRLEYVGDASGVAKLLSYLPRFDENYIQNMFSLQTGAEPYGLTIYYEPAANGAGQAMQSTEAMTRYAGYLFENIGNLGYIEYACRPTPSGPELDKSAYTVLLKVER